ncbi:MAG: hypothetical protein KH900_17660, partial [[Clostridium] symbiosum]|nr:hypothetical protein [[Clostridium] symbiosum]
EPGSVENRPFGGTEPSSVEMQPSEGNRTEFRWDTAVRGEQNRVPLRCSCPGTELSSVENRPSVNRTGFR